MMPPAPLAQWRVATADWLIAVVLPIGWLILLTGMFWIGERPDYHRSYYLLIAAPTLLALMLRPSYLKPVFSCPLILTFVLFSLYTLLSLSWSDTDNATQSLSKRPLYVLMLLLSASLIGLRAPKRLKLTLHIAAVVATLAGLISLGLYYQAGASGRFSGYGALYNPLLSAHVYGFFMALWAALWFRSKRLLDPWCLISLGTFATLLLATGSRTPLVAMTACLLWLSLLHCNRRSLIAVTALAVAGAALLLWPGNLLDRGLSYRPEIWAHVWQRVMEAPWLGHGFDSKLEIVLPGIDQTLTDPHNILLAVLYYCGVAGLIPWLGLYAIAFVHAWRHRHERLAMVASALLMFGLAASMTEGGAFISRPKEHWFLIWIPFALVAASMQIGRQKARGDTASEPPSTFMRAT